MKKNFTFWIAVVLILFSAVTLSSLLHSGAGIKDDSFLRDNLDALSDSESIYQQPTWFKYYRDDGGFNCVCGGTVEC